MAKMSYQAALAAVSKSKKAQKRRASGVMATVYVTEEEVQSGKVKKKLRKAFGKLV
jgi:hypothetical protein